MTLAEELRARANDMREKGMVDWAYLCLTAADHISLLEAEVNEQARLLGDSGSTEARLRARIKELEATEKQQGELLVDLAGYIEEREELMARIVELREAADGAFDAWARGGETLYSHMIQLRDAAMRQEQGI